MALIFDYANSSKTELLAEITFRQSTGRSINPKSSSLSDLADALKADDAAPKTRPPMQVAQASVVNVDDSKPVEIGEPFSMSNLARLWQGDGPAPRTLAEYRCRIVATGPDFFALYDRAEARYAELQEMATAVTAVLRPRPDHTPVLMQKAAETLDTDDAERVLAAWQQNAALESFFRLYQHSLQDLTTHAPARKLEREFPNLFTELVQNLLEPALGRVEAELARIRPIEERRLREAAEQEAVACGLSPSKAKTPPTSALVANFEAFASELSDTLKKIKSGSNGIGGTSFPQFWLTELQSVVRRLREQHRAWLGNSAAIAA